MTPSRAARARRRRARAIGGLAILVGAVGGLFLFLGRGPHIEIPADPCATRPPLVHFQGVVLQPLAMEAFKRAQRSAGRPIEVVASYRSCGAQRLACRNICGDPNGCPGECAKPGQSWHQLGAAIDVSTASLDFPAILAALRDSGWCQPLPSSDPGHFSFDGCH